MSIYSCTPITKIEFSRLRSMWSDQSFFFRNESRRYWTSLSLLPWFSRQHHSLWSFLQGNKQRFLPSLSGTPCLSVAPKSDSVKRLSVKDCLTDPALEKSLVTNDNRIKRNAGKLNERRHRQGWGLSLYYFYFLREWSKVHISLIS